LRVLHIGKFYPPDHVGGIETYTRNLCLRLRDDVDFRVVVSGQSRQTVSETVEGVPVLRLGTALKIGSAPISRGLRKLLSTPQADLLHFHLPHPAAVMAFRAAGGQNRSLPVVCTYHSDIVRQRIAGALLAPMHRDFLRRCDAIIVSSPN